MSDSAGHSGAGVGVDSGRRLYRLPTRRHSVELGAKIGRVLAPGDLVILSGDLGAGKTFLARAIARALGVADRVPSPTFTLVNEYPCAIGTLLHVDLYRVRGENLALELSRLGLYQRRLEGSLLVVEWGEGAESGLGGRPALTVALAIAGEHERIACIGGQRASDIL
ncbi:MAG TPA: tRNA (adenosine(37)-N6)-threonylcarbamoyltransferase complex ATPase subunit type 1 TsaE [Polyangiaceae bacterium]|nr:tRNA (adenosine(37)-N6)-threonylcarbamoyltransferase complex ATPase subunit type 1 TsaE [Polyangiaceae bacterium]